MLCPLTANLVKRRSVIRTKGLESWLFDRDTSAMANGNNELTGR